MDGYPSCMSWPVLKPAFLTWESYGLILNKLEECLLTEAKLLKNMSVINICQTRFSPNPNKNLSSVSHEGPALLKRLWCDYGLGVVYWSSLELCNVNNVFMSLTCKNVISNCLIGYSANRKYDAWPSSSTRPRAVGRAEAWLWSESDKALFEWHAAGGSVAGPASMYRCQGLPQGWGSEGSDSKASSTWAHAHGRSVYKHHPGILQRERQVRCYVTTPKRIASLPAARRAASPTLGQSSWMLFFRRFRHSKLRIIIIKRN